MASENYASVCVERRLDWHLQGCVERYGAVGDGPPCRCVKRLQAIEAAARAAVDELYPFDPCELDAKEIELLTALRSALEAK